MALRSTEILYNSNEFILSVNVYLSEDDSFAV